MRRIFLLCVILVAAMYAGVATPAETTISDPNSAKWVPYGKAKPKYVKTDSVPGGVALRMAIRSKGKNPWDIGVSAPMLGDVAQGEAVVAGFFARVESPPKNRQTATIVARMQQNATPYDSAMQASVDIDDAWTFYCIEGIAARNISKGSLELTLQLASDKQTLDIGPYLVSKHGPDEKAAVPCQKRIKAAS
jgi:hypothetical protein